MIAMLSGQRMERRRHTRFDTSTSGSKLAWIGRWDNSADNPANPDPSKEVRWGLQTWDEMHNGWMETLHRRTDKPKSTTP